MPIGPWSLQWANLNSQRSYPIADWGTKRDATDTITIPNSFIVGLHLSVHAGMEIEPGRFFLQTLAISSTGYKIVIGYDDDSSEPPSVASVTVSKVTHTENRSYVLGGVGDFYDVDAHIEIGKLDEIDALPPGSYTFDPAATPLEPDVVRPIIRGVSALTVVNGQDRSDPLVGDIEFLAGENMRITVNLEGEIPQIVWSAISGEGLNESCICDEEGEGPCIRFINGIPPLPDGNYRMVGDDCVAITPIANGLQFADACSKPCCGCEELTALTSQLDRLADGARTYSSFAGQLNATVTQLSILMSSRIGNQGCIECE